MYFFSRRPFKTFLPPSLPQPIKAIKLEKGGACRDPTLAFTNSNNYDVFDDEDDGDVINANSDDGDKKN